MSELVLVKQEEKNYTDSLMYSYLRALTPGRAKMGECAKTHANARNENATFFYKYAHTHVFVRTHAHTNTHNT